MRYSIIDSDYAHPVSAVAGVNLCPIWDEDLEGIVAWVRTDRADLLVKELNDDGEDTRKGVTIDLREEEDGSLDLTASFDPVYSAKGDNPITHEVAMEMIRTIPSEEIDYLQTEAAGKVEVIKKSGDEP